MAGFFIVIMWLLLFGLVFFGGFYLVYSYILESIFRMNTCGGPKWTAWIPFYGQYQLGRLAGMEKLGILTAVCHPAAILLAVWWVCDPLVFSWCCLLLPLVVGFICKNMTVSEIFKVRAGERADLYNILSMVTLGALRPIFLFVIRKKVIVFSKNT